MKFNISGIMNNAIRHFRFTPAKSIRASKQFKESTSAAQQHGVIAQKATGRDPLNPRDIVEISDEAKRASATDERSKTTTVTPTEEAHSYLRLLDKDSK